ncbi:MAG: tRNA pseudouridine(13) synthase TruD [Candidatus Lokiarchaeota archaeon]|nr:tRNA pseudouridine(13) synthase TruD [Candidatus Lokiarchaeota archaeon]
MLKKGKNYFEFENNEEREVEKFVGIEIFSSPHINGFKGIYKYNFKDFIVKEILDNGKVLEIKEDYKTPPFSEESRDQYTTFNLVKLNKDTFEAVRQIANAVNVPINEISYSGLKDKCAISVQKVSIRGNHIARLKKLRIRDIFIRSILPSKRPINIGDNWGNHFTITLRNIEPQPDLRKKIETLFSFLEKYGFPNYYGLQRFGTYRPNSHRIGRFLVKEDFKEVFQEFTTTVYSTESKKMQEVRRNFADSKNLEKALDEFPESITYERSMIDYLINNPGDYKGAVNELPEDLKNIIMSAFQSYLFNRAISMRVKEGFSLFAPEPGDVIGILDDDRGRLTQVKYIYGNKDCKYDKFLDKALTLNRAVIVVPIIGYDTNLDDFPLMKQFFSKILEEEELNPKIFQSKRFYEFEFKGTIRAMIVKPLGLELKTLTNDEEFPDKKKLKFEFALPKGSYATMLLRELIK